MRIVSMLASATEAVYALGLGDHLVAVSHECDYPPDALRLPLASRSRFDPSGLTSREIDAAVRRSMEEHGSVYEVDRDLLARLRPDLVLTQAVCEVCAVPTGSVLDAVRSLPTPPAVLSLDAHTLDGILSGIGEIAAAAGMAERGEEVVGGLRARLDRVSEAVAGERRPRTLLLEWLDPLFSPGHWVPEMVALAGGDLLLGGAGERSVEVGRGEVEDLDPDVLLIEPCGYGLEEARADADAHREALLGIAGRAVAAGDAWLLHSSYFSRSGPRVVDGVEALARLLHPHRFVDPPAPSVAERWR
jgi:iron complex transport system substrate-binding protein